MSFELEQGLGIIRKLILLSWIGLTVRQAPTLEVDVGSDYSSVFELLPSEDGRF